jgi:RimJ/RimL family protein N-acetyltransferase
LRVGSNLPIIVIYFHTKKMKTQIQPFTDEFIPEAGILLAQRHARNRARLPLLPVRFEDPYVAGKAVQAVWEKKYKNGYAALRGDKLVAYLIGNFHQQSWGRCGYVYQPGYALAEGESPEVIQDLYARLGDDWVLRGIFSHGMYVSAADSDVIEAMFNLGFGRERVDALLDLRTLEIPKTETPVGVTVRRAGPGDNAHLGSLSDVIFRALAKPPYWHPTPPEEWSELYEGWSELADNKEWMLWLAFDGDEVIGSNGFIPLPEADTDLLASPRTVSLSVAATKPPARGRGVSAHLTWLGLEEMCKEGYELCFTDWISPNLLAARHWPKFGFQNVAYRLSKRVDPQITWTR